MIVVIFNDPLLKATPWIVKSCLIVKGKATFLKDAIVRRYKTEGEALQFCKNVGAKVHKRIRVKRDRHAIQLNMYGQRI